MMGVAQRDENTHGRSAVPLAPARSVIVFRGGASNLKVIS